MFCDQKKANQVKEEVTVLKRVRYNGNKRSYYGCSDSRLLTPGKVYEVVGIQAMAWQTNYVLAGIDNAAFNSMWFYDVDEVDEVKV